MAPVLLGLLARLRDPALQGALHLHEALPSELITRVHLKPVRFARPGSEDRV